MDREFAETTQEMVADDEQGEPDILQQAANNYILPI